MKRLFKYPVLNLAVIAAITLFFAFQLPKTALSNDVLTFIPKNHKEVVNYDRVKEQFGSNLVIDVALEVPYGTIFNADFLNLVKKLTDSFGAIPGVIKVDSLSSTDIIRGTDEGMEVVPLLDDYRGTEQEVKDLKANLLSWDIYRGFLYSEDFTSTQIGIKIDPDIETKKINAIYFEIKNILNNTDTGGTNWYIAGIPAITVLINTQMKGDLIFLIPLVVLVVIGTLFISFRRLGGVVLPLSTVVISGIWTIGAMALAGIQLSLMDTVIPVILVAVGSAYGIHIVSHYYDEIDRENTDMTPDRHREIIFETLHRIGIPVVLAGVTTLVGFGSLISSTVIPMKTFGTFTAAGVMISLIVALVFIPSVLLVRGKALKPTESEKDENPAVERFIDYLYGVFHRNKGKIMILTLLIIAAGITGTTRIVKDNVLIEYFKPDTEISKSDKFLRDKFNGTTTFDIVVKGSGKGSMTDPRILSAMDSMSSYLKEKYPEVTSILSFTDFVKKMNQVMNSSSPEPEPITEEEQTDSIGFSSFFTDTESENTPAAEPQTASSDTETSTGLSNTFTYNDFLRVLNAAYISGRGRIMSAGDLVEEINRELNYQGASYYEIPTDPAKYPAETEEELKNLISQYLLLFSGELGDWTDDNLEPSMIKMLVQMNTPGTILPQRIAEDAETYAEAHFPPGYTMETVGTSKIMYALTILITSSQTRSILISLVLVFIILTINYKSLLAGIIGIVPIGLTVLINFGVMGLFRIRLDISTAMVSAVSIGIGIDYTIHYLSYYKFERQKTDNLEAVAHRTLKGVGKAIIFNAFSVAGGFLVMLLSNFTPLNYFGLLVAITMITSSTASLTLLPILLETIKPKFIYKEKTI